MQLHSKVMQWYGQKVSELLKMLLQRTANPLSAQKHCLLICNAIFIDRTTQMHVHIHNHLTVFLESKSQRFSKSFAKWKLKHINVQLKKKKTTNQHGRHRWTINSDVPQWKSYCLFSDYFNIFAAHLTHTKLVRCNPVKQLSTHLSQNNNVSTWNPCQLEKLESLSALKL